MENNFLFTIILLKYDRKALGKNKNFIKSATTFVINNTKH